MFTPLAKLSWVDVADVLFLTVVAYYLYLWFRGTKAIRALIGLVVMGACYTLARFWGLFLTTWVFQILWQVLVILLLILFQNEIRQVLERVSPFRPLGRHAPPRHRETIIQVAQVAREAARLGWGALMVLVRQDPLADLVNEGLAVEARSSVELLLSIFNPKSPAHDGAVVIEGDRIARMGVYLPLTTKEDLPSFYGTRHRAAMGVSETGDAVVVVVSEERGQISLAVKGKMTPLEDPRALEAELIRLLQVQAKPPRSFWVRSGRAVIAHWPAKLGAFVLVCLIWLTLAGQQNYQVSLLADITYRGLETSLEVAELSDRQVRLGLVGPRRLASSAKPEDVKVEVYLWGQESGSHQVTLIRQNIQVPLGLEVVSVEPKVIRVNLQYTRPTPPEKTP